MKVLFPLFPNKIFDKLCFGSTIRVLLRYKQQLRELHRLPISELFFAELDELEPNARLDRL
jgi:hypothetical protein